MKYKQMILGKKNGTRPDEFKYNIESERVPFSF